MNINATYSRYERYLADDGRDSQLIAAPIAGRGTGVRQRPACTNTQDRAYRSRTDQFDLRWFHGFTDKQIVPKGIVGIQVTDITTIHKTVQACKGRPDLLIGYSQRAIFLIRFDNVKLVFD